MKLRNAVYPVILMLLLQVGCSGQEKMIQGESDEISQGEEAVQKEIAQPPQVMNRAVTLPLEINRVEGYYQISGTAVTEETRAIETDQGLRIILPNHNEWMIELDGMTWVEAPPLNLTDQDKALPAKEGYFLFIREGETYTLYHQSGDNRIRIVDQIPENGVENHIIKTDGSRIAYFDMGQQKIHLFNIHNQRISQVTDFMADEMGLPIQDNGFFSPLGGYLTLLKETKEGVRGFETYGADTGRQIHELIYGIEPVWSGDEDHIAFLYQEVGKPVEELTIQNETVKLSDKLAVLNRKTKRVSIWDEFFAPEWIMGAPEWSRDSGYLIYHSGADQPTNLNLLQLDQKSITHVQAENQEGEDQLLIMGQPALVENKLLYTFGEADGPSTLRIIQEFGEAATDYEDIQPFYVNNGSSKVEQDFLVLESGVIYVKENAVYFVTTDRSACVYRNSMPIQSIQWLAASNYLLVQVQKPDELTYVLVPLTVNQDSNDH